MDKKRQVMDLWRTCFNDSEAFIRLYFDRVYRDENTLTIEKDGKVISALQMLPYTMTYEGEEVPLAYISGACTTPEERGKDWMRRLINEAFEEMERRGVALTALIPANRGLFDFYGNFGYAEVFRYSLEAYTFPDSPPSRSDIKVSIPINPYDHVWFAYLDRKLHEYPACVLHSYDDYQTIVSDALLSGERLYIAIHKEKEIAGMAFARCEEKSEDVYIKALFCDSPEAGKAIAQEAAMRNKVWSALIQAPPTDSGSFSYGMARIIDKKRMIRLWLSHQTEPRYTEKELKTMDIRKLTSLLLDRPNKRPYMSLMLD